MRRSTGSCTTSGSWGRSTSSATACGTPCGCPVVTQPGSVAVLFSDEAEDLAPWRVVSVDVADRAAGTLRIDLNRTLNLPYAFSDFGTCPAPVEGNHLPFAVTAGERDPRGSAS